MSDPLRPAKFELYHACVPTMAKKKLPTSKHFSRRRLLIQTHVFHMKGGEGVGSGYSIEVKLSSTSRAKETGSDTALSYPVSNSFSRQASHSR